MADIDIFECFQLFMFYILLFGKQHKISQQQQQTSHKNILFRNEARHKNKITHKTNIEQKKNKQSKKNKNKINIKQNNLQIKKLSIQKEISNMLNNYLFHVKISIANKQLINPVYKFIVLRLLCMY